MFHPLPLRQEQSDGDLARRALGEVQVHLQELAAAEARFAVHDLVVDELHPEVDGASAHLAVHAHHALEAHGRIRGGFLDELRSAHEVAPLHEAVGATVRQVVPGKA